ncbi:ECF transporter S component [Levilactobacillus bambusae]|uniref:Riboflavin transporter n=1 Tax=Levilactobacillus bambusae TaxID=2024736 RepID=A0A2V1N0N1_9LACO|nr:ECF transporter S component [Levilactobacillus bambusae]PWG00797.1 ECF transporter S component [Levilactobacillus bambusae]
MVNGTHHTRFSVRTMVQVALFACCAYILMFLSFPIIPFVSYMKLDFSEVVILLAMVILGPTEAILVSAIEALLYFVTTGVDIPNLIGVGTAFIAALAFMLPIYWTAKALKNQTFLRRAIVSVLVGTLTLTVVMALANWLVITPLYLNVLHMSIGMPLSKLVLLGVIPFNLLKGVIIGIVFIFMMQRMNGWIATHRNQF